MMLRIYANQWHIYAGLAVPSPSVLTQINQFSKSMTELFKLVKRVDKEGLRERIYGARGYDFDDAHDGGAGDGKERNSIFLSEDILDRSHSSLLVCSSDSHRDHRHEGSQPTRRSQFPPRPSCNPYQPSPQRVWTQLSRPPHTTSHTALMTYGHRKRSTPEPVPVTTSSYVTYNDPFPGATFPLLCPQWRQRCRHFPRRYCRGCTTTIGPWTPIYLHCWGRGTLQD